MRASIVTALIAACVVAFALAAKAQDAGQAPKEHTMTGCLQTGTEANTYVVMNTADKGPKTIGIVESKANLAPHVGHKIDITGAAIPPKEAESANPKAPKADHRICVADEARHGLPDRRGMEGVVAAHLSATEPSRGFS